MRKKTRQSTKAKIVGGLAVLIFLVAGYVYLGELFPDKYDRAEAKMAAAGLIDSSTGSLQSSTTTIPVYAAPTLNIVDYDRRMIKLANYASTTASTTKHSWPAKTVYPKTGAILPFKRVIAYYGNLYSKGMGILGEYPPDEVLRRLDIEVKKWELADPETPVQPALHYIVTTAQLSAGEDGKHRLRMPTTEIDKVLAMAKKSNAIVFLDIQVGLSNVRSELPLLETYLKMPQVHLGVDPEFSMKTGARPGTEIGTLDAADINYAAEYLAKLVQDNNLPPKILIIHRFTGPMVTNYKLIKPLPEVQIVINMDGWGSPAKKIDTYQGFVASEPVQFTGFKLFYKNDLKQVPHRLMTSAELLKLKPQPIYIQYQ
ncbi:MAG: hypothetical protein WC640_03940 [Candidatus Paceibacterota bacterium]|jgi:hypothetical protein